MAIVASISVSQGSNPANLTITDTTVNENSETYTDRYLTILDSSNEALADYPNPIDFSFASYPTGAITLTGFTVDLALNIVMTLVPTVVDPASEYEAIEDVAMNRYLQQGVYNIQEARFIENQLVGLASVQAQLNSIDIIIEQQNSQTAVLYGSLTGAQNALTRGQNIIDSQVL
jgi:hypothetical protein